MVVYIFIVIVNIFLRKYSYEVHVITYFVNANLSILIELNFVYKLACMHLPTCCFSQ